jgi:hypothetical protein
MKIERLYEFLNLEKYYPYHFLYHEIIKPKIENGLYYRGSYNYIYEFFTKSEKEYIVRMSYDGGANNEMSLDWAEREDWIKERREKGYTAFVKKYNWNDHNINEVEMILNTVFKILIDFTNKYKIGIIRLGSYDKSKYKNYKKIIQGLDQFEIINDKVIPPKDYGNWPDDNFYEIDFIKKGYQVIPEDQEEDKKKLNKI